MPLSTLEGRNPLRAKYLAASFWAQNFLQVGKYEAAFLTALVLLIDDSPIMFLHNPPTDMYSSTGVFLNIALACLLGGGGNNVENGWALNVKERGVLPWSDI